MIVAGPRCDFAHEHFNMGEFLNSLKYKSLTMKRWHPCQVWGGSAGIYRCDGLPGQERDVSTCFKVLSSLPDQPSHCIRLRVD